MKVKSESDVAQWCPTLSDPMDCSLPGSSVHGIFQARVLEWGAIAYMQKPMEFWEKIGQALSSLGMRKEFLFLAEEISVNAWIYKDHAYSKKDGKFGALGP